MGTRRRRPPAPEIQPVDVDGVQAVGVGTLLWTIAFVVLLFFREALQQTGREWWLWTCLAGAGLGALGFEYCRRRRDRLEAVRHSATADEVAWHDASWHDSGSVQPEEGQAKRDEAVRRAARRRRAGKRESGKRESGKRESGREPEATIPAATMAETADWAVDHQARASSRSRDESATQAEPQYQTESRRSQSRARSGSRAARGAAPADEAETPRARSRDGRRRASSR